MPSTYQPSRRQRQSMCKGTEKIGTNLKDVNESSIWPYL
jgi:hypothetical protein